MNKKIPLKSGDKAQPGDYVTASCITCMTTIQGVYMGKGVLGTAIVCSQLGEEVYHFCDPDVVKVKDNDLFLPGTKEFVTKMRERLRLWGGDPL